MDVRTMRRVDRWLGVPLAAGLSVVRRASRLGRSRRPGPARPVERIAFLKLSEQGATVLAYDALRAAIRRVGAERVHVVVFEENRFILDVMGVIPRENVIAIPTGSVAAALLGTLDAVRRLRRLRVDATVDLELFARSTAILAYLSGARRRVGHHAFAGDGPYRGRLLTHPVAYSPHVHASVTCRLLVDALDVDPDALPALDLRPDPAETAPPPFRPAPEAVTAVERLLREASGRDDARPLVLLNANCSDIMPLRAWPADRYVELARRLLGLHEDLLVGWTGAPGEAAAVDALATRVGSPRSFSLAGRTTLAELLTLYTLAEVMVTNDSGPAHFASLTPLDVVTLFGPETPRLYAARTPRTHVLYAGVACSPCISALNNRTSRCRDNVCMQRIGVEEVLGVVQDRLAARRAAAIGPEAPDYTGRP